MFKSLKKFANDELGATAIEYGLTALMIIAPVGAVGNRRSGALNEVTNNLH